MAQQKTKQTTFVINPDVWARATAAAAAAGQTTAGMIKADLLRVTAKGMLRIKETEPFPLAQSLRLPPLLVERPAELEKESGLTQSQVIRRVIERVGS